MSGRQSYILRENDPGRRPRRKSARFSRFRLVLPPISDHALALGATGRGHRRYFQARTLGVTEAPQSSEDCHSRCLEASWRRCRSEAAAARRVMGKSNLCPTTGCCGQRQLECVMRHPSKLQNAPWLRQCTSGGACNCERVEPLRHRQPAPMGCAGIPWRRPPYAIYPPT